MPKHLSIKDNFYIFRELKALTNNFTDLNLINLTKFIEAKTDNQYTVVSGEFIKDANWQFLNHRLFILTPVTDKG